MTYSILATDPHSGAIGGAAATGSLCVGGWVLRGRIDAGMSASQGASPSTFWGEDVLALMHSGQSVAAAVTHVTARDTGRQYRQLSALSPAGDTAVFTGDANQAVRGSRETDGVVAAGNMLGGEAVLDAVLDAFRAQSASFAESLLAALLAGEAAGSDSRGLMSAAILVFYPDLPPLNLRVDYSLKPLDDLAVLLKKATSGDYADWTRQVPNPDAPQRGLD